MKVLMVSCLPEEYNNSSSLCVQLLCKGFLKNGHSVFFVTPYPDLKNKYYCPDYKFEDKNLFHIRYWKENVKENDHIVQNGFKLKVKNFFLKIYRKFDLFGRSINCLNYVKEVYKELKSKQIYPDVIISTSDPKTSHLFASKLFKYLKKAPYYIQYWGDPLLRDITQKSLLPKAIKKKIEKAILKKANKIIYVSPFTLAEQKKLFPCLSKYMAYLPTPCEETNYTQENKVVLGYFGSYHSSVRDIMPLYNAVKDKKNIYLYLIGDSDIKLNNLENIQILDRISTQDLQRYYNKCSVLVELTNKIGAQIPAKIFRDAGSNREVVIIYELGDGELIKDYFSQFNRFSFCKNTVEDIKKLLDYYLSLNIPERTPEKAFLYYNVAESILQFSGRG